MFIVGQAGGPETEIRSFRGPLKNTGPARSDLFAPVLNWLRVRDTTHDRYLGELSTDRTGEAPEGWGAVYSGTPGARSIDPERVVANAGAYRAEKRHFHGARHLVRMLAKVRGPG